MESEWVTDREPYADELEPIKHASGRWGRFLIYNGYSIDIEVYALPPKGSGYWLGGGRHIKAWRKLPEAPALDPGKAD
jgi:hypothetical protein